MNKILVLITLISLNISAQTQWYNSRSDILKFTYSTGDVVSYSFIDFDQTLRLDLDKEDILMNFEVHDKVDKLQKENQEYSNTLAHFGLGFPVFDNEDKIIGVFLTLGSMEIEDAIDSVSVFGDHKKFSAGTKVFYSFNKSGDFAALSFRKIFGNDVRVVKFSSDISLGKKWKLLTDLNLVFSAKPNQSSLGSYETSNFEVSSLYALKPFQIGVTAKTLYMTTPSLENRKVFIGGTIRFKL